MYSKYWFKRWRGGCRECGGSGGGPDSTCEACAGQGICPRCGSSWDEVEFNSWFCEDLPCPACGWNHGHGEDDQAVWFIGDEED